LDGSSVQLLPAAPLELAELAGLRVTLQMAEPVNSAPAPLMARCRFVAPDGHVSSPYGDAAWSPQYSAIPLRVTVLPGDQHWSRVFVLPTLSESEFELFPGPILGNSRLEIRLGSRPGPDSPSGAGWGLATVDVPLFSQRSQPDLRAFGSNYGQGLVVGEGGEVVFYLPQDLVDAPLEEIYLENVGPGILEFEPSSRVLPVQLDPLAGAGIVPVNVTKSGPGVLYLRATAGGPVLATHSYVVSSVAPVSFSAGGGAFVGLSAGPSWEVEAELEDWPKLGDWYVNARCSPAKPLEWRSVWFTDCTACTPGAEIVAGPICNVSSNPQGVYAVAQCYKDTWYCRRKETTTELQAWAYQFKGTETFECNPGGWSGGASVTFPIYKKVEVSVSASYQEGPHYKICCRLEALLDSQQEKYTVTINVPDCKESQFLVGADPK
jgi:hypothetical protein